LLAPSIRWALPVAGWWAYAAVSLSTLSSGTQKPVSSIPNGAKMRVLKNSSRSIPDTTSTTLPSTSVAIE